MNNTTTIRDTLAETSEIATTEIVSLGPAKYEIGRKLRAIFQGSHTWESLAEKFAYVLEHHVPVASDEFIRLRARMKQIENAPKIEFHQHDFIAGFAGFRPGSTYPAPDSRAFCVLNVGSILATVHCGEVSLADVPYFVAENMMREIMHALEQWAGVAFSEERIEALLESYRTAYRAHIDGQPKGDA